MRVIHAAKWLGVAPWDLAEREDEWTEWAMFLMGLEHKAQERQQAKAARARKGGKR